MSLLSENTPPLDLSTLTRILPHIDNDLIVDERVVKRECEFETEGG